MKNLPFNKLALLLVGAVFSLSYIFYEQFWGINHFRFLPKPLQLILAIFVVALAFRIFSSKTSKGTLINLSDKAYLIGLPIISILTVVLLPLSIDVYGDSRSITNNFERIFNADKSWFDTLSKVLSLNIFDLHSGEKLTFNLAFLIHQITGVGFTGSFTIINTIFTALSAIFYALFSLKVQNVNRLVAALIFLSGNYILILSGHIEVYGASIGFAFLFIYLLKRHIERNTWNSYFLLVLAAFLLMKSHINHLVVLFPVFLFLAIRLKGDIFNRLTVKNSLVLLISGLVGFLLAYFLVFENQVSLYAERGDDVLNNVFLPLFANDAPYDNYSLLNFNHFTDWLTLLFMWSPIAMLLLIIAAIKQNWEWTKAPINVLLLFLSLTYALIAFVINPLLSMPRDWDLLSLGAPFLITLGLQILPTFSNEKRVSAKKLSIIGLAFLLFVLPRYIVESNKQWSSNRLLSVGAHVYKTYYAGSSVLLSASIKEQQEPDYESLKEFSLNLSDKSKVYPDNELCHYYTQAAYWLADEQNKTILALDFFRLALEQNKNYELALKGAAIILQNKNNLPESLPLVETLLQLQPNVKEYHRMLLNCYVGLEKQKELQIAVNNYLKLFPEDRELIKSKLGI